MQLLPFLGEKQTEVSPSYASMWFEVKSETNPYWMGRPARLSVSNSAFVHLSHSNKAVKETDMEI